MAGLRISPDLELPVDAVTQAIAILARKGAGKTYTASVLVEEVVRAKVPVAVLDPTGAWWGLRSSVDGDRPGLPVVIFGGDHGDVPLDRTAGHEIANVVLEYPGAYIVDLSAFESKAAEQRFAADFLERLYRGKRPETGPLLLVVDEADFFAPQQPRDKGDQLRTLGALESIVRRGRIKGLGDLLITQRAAVLNKNVLEQTEVLVAMQTTGPRDRAAIDAWIEGNGTREERDEVLGSLASLERGEAWVWSPSFLRVLRRVRIRARTTYDSSRTPGAGEIPIAPRAFAPVDLERLGERIRAAAEQAKANDPAELRRQLAEARRLLDRPAVAAEPITVERLGEVEVPVLNGEVGLLVGLSDSLRSVGREIADVGQKILEAIDRVNAAPRPAQQPVTAGAPRPAGRTGAPDAVASPPRAVGTLDAPAAPASLGRAERLILATLAQHADGLSRIQLSILTGYSIKSSSFANALGALRSAGYVTKGGEPIQATDAGRANAGDVELLPPPGQALVDYWLAKLEKAERAVLTVLVDAFPDDLTRDEIADRSGYSATSSSFANALGKLRSLRLVDGLRASADLVGR